MEFSLGKCLLSTYYVRGAGDWEIRTGLAQTTCTVGLLNQQHLLRLPSAMLHVTPHAAEEQTGVST